MHERTLDTTRVGVLNVSDEQIGRTARAGTQGLAAIDTADVAGTRCPQTMDPLVAHAVPRRRPKRCSLQECA